MKLFVSHSSKTPANRKLLQKVCAGLRQRDFDVLVDRDGQLYAGVDWDLRINEWMAECHAAVILVSTAALRDSDWVKKEATVLSWRRELQDDFKLIPVLLEGITPEDLEQGLMGVLRIIKSQCIRNAHGAERIVLGIEAGLGPAYRPALTPFERLENVLVEILEGQAKPQTLEDAWQALAGAHKPQWQPNSGRRFASALTRFLLRDSRHALEHLQTVLDRIRPRVDRSAAEELLKYLACLWVDAQAATGISSAAHGGGIVGLNGHYLPNFTARRYGERAWPLRDQWRFVPVDATRRTFPAIREAIRESFRPRGVKVPDASIDRRIAQYQAPVLVLIPSREDPAQLPDEALLDELRRSYPNLIYLIGTGPTVPDWVPEPIRPLVPALDLDLEEDRFFALHDIEDFINNRLHGGP
jgi:hypothetical protein